MPIAINEPLGFESKASTICASFYLDHATSADIVNSVKQQFPAIRNQETVYVLDPKPALRASSLTSVLSAPGGPTDVQLIANSTVSAAPATSHPPATPPTTPALLTATPDTVPIKQRRQFSCGSPAYTTWYSTASPKDLACPQEVTPVVGELYIHHNRLEDAYQIWLYRLDSVWKCVTKAEKVYHPTIDDRVLSMRANGTPNWITTASYTTIRGRKGRRMQVE